MKKSFCLVFTVLLFSFLHVHASNLKIIQSINVETDYNYQGVRGLNITYRYNFLPLEEENHNDTLLRGCTFTIKTNLFENNNAIEPANGYKSVINTDGDLEFTITLMGADIVATKFDNKVSQFIPYASLKLNQGNHTINVIAEIKGKDATGFLHQQKIEKAATTFTKPATKTFTLNIDYIEVNTLNSKGQAWDYAIFRTDAPDVGVDVLIGNTSVFKNNVNDTYMYAVGPNSKNISFTISENDKVSVLVQDIDVLFHDFIAKWNFSTNDKKTGTLYAYNKVKGNIKSCNLTFKID